MASSLFVFGDFVAQHGLESAALADHDWFRTLRQASYGLFFAGPATFTWYRFLERRVNLTTPIRTLFARVGLDQALFAPTFSLVFFTYMNATEGGDLATLQSKLSAAYLPALIANYKLWPAVQLANFYLVPLPYRVAVVNLVAIGWNSYLSNLNKRASAGAV